MAVSQPLQSARNLAILLAALTYCTCLVSTFPSPQSAPKTRRTLLPPAANVSTLSAPVPPPEFDTDIRYDNTIFLNPLGIYLCAIDCMYTFAQVGWDNVFLGGFTVWAQSFNVQIDIEAASGDYGSLDMETSHIIFALYETIVDIAAKSRFVAEVTTISLHKRQIGLLLIEKMPPQTLESNAMSYPSGQYDDPNDPEFSVSYTYSGARINSKGILLAVLDALATCAQFSPEMPFESLGAASASGDCVISIAQVDGPIKVNYSFVTKNLSILVKKIIVPLNKFEAITIQLKWETAVIAEASIQLADHGRIAA